MPIQPLQLPVVCQHFNTDNNNTAEWGLDKGALQITELNLRGGKLFGRCQDHLTPSVLSREGFQPVSVLCCVDEVVNCDQSGTEKMT